HDVPPRAPASPRRPARRPDEAPRFFRVRGGGLACGVGGSPHTTSRVIGLTVQDWPVCRRYFGVSPRRTRTMESRIVEIGLALGVGLCCACDPGDPELEAFREGALVQGGQHTQARAGGGGTWLGNGLEDPDISGLDPAYGL